MPPPLTRGGLGIPQSFASSPEAPLLGELSAKQTERLDEGWPDREALAKLNLSVIAYAMPPPLTRGGLGIPQSFASSPEAPLLGELSAKQTERLDEGWPDREALAKLNLSVTADAVPPPLTRGGLGIPQSFASSPEAPLLGELAGASPTERLDKGQPDREALAGLNLSVIAYAMPPPLPRGGLGIPQSFASSPEAPLPGATATTAASGGNRESLLGPRPAGCKRQRSRRWVPQPGLVERSETERLDEGQPDRKPLTFGHSETGDAVCLYIICPMTAA